jgi:hypothetical protein
MVRKGKRSRVQGGRHPEPYAFRTLADACIASTAAALADAVTSMEIEESAPLFTLQLQGSSAAGVLLLHFWLPGQCAAWAQPCQLSLMVMTTYIAPDYHRVYHRKRKR